MSAYEEAVLKARKKFINLNKTQEKELLKLYKELANQLSSEIASCRTTSQDAYLRKLNEIEREKKFLEKQVGTRTVCQLNWV